MMGIAFNAPLENTKTNWLPHLFFNAIPAQKERSKTKWDQATVNNAII